MHCVDPHLALVFDLESTLKWEAKVLVQHIEAFNIPGRMKGEGKDCFWIKNVEAIGNSNFFGGQIEEVIRSLR
ncbi:hypothetical protein GCM10007047_02870 [Cerasicoccus arenae]|uniref:Uncharacterized protein n=1 Tax=Cerasicoccus arenae TaxID=424488 RepID=A0A8J3D9E3_9BACT|nr:hypothetical protein GCM10007047_02870 [Cerasicoccus arenae]